MWISHERRGRGERRVRLSDAVRGRRRLAQLARSPGQHRERELPGDRDRRRRGDDDVLGAELRHARRLGLAAASSAAASTVAVSVSPSVSTARNSSIAAGATNPSAPPVAATRPASSSAVGATLSSSASVTSASAGLAPSAFPGFPSPRLGERERVPRLDDDLLGLALGG